MKETNKNIQEPRVTAFFVFFLAAILFFLGNGKLRLFLPEIDIEIGGDIGRYLLIIAVLWLIHVARDSTIRKQLKQTGMTFPLIAAGILLVSLLSFQPVGSIAAGVAIFPGMIFSLIIATEIRSSRHVCRMLIGLAAGTAATLGVLIAGISRGSPLMAGPYSSIRTPVGDVAETSLFVVMALSLIIAAPLFSEKKISRWLWMATIMAGNCVAILTLSPFLVGFGMTVAALALIILGWRTNIAVFRSGIVLLVVNVIAVFFALSLILGHGVLSFSDYLVRTFVSTAEGELTLVKKVLFDYPLTGLGFGQGSREYLLSLYREAGCAAPSNLYSAGMVYSGFIGLAIMIVLFRFLAGRTMTIQEPVSNDWRANVDLSVKVTFVAFAFLSLMVNPLENTRIMVLFWFLCGERLVTMLRDKETAEFWQERSIIEQQQGKDQE